MGTRKRLLLLEAAVCLAVSRLAIAALPFRWLSGALRQQQGEAPRDEEAAVAQCERVTWALQQLRRRAPWSGNCLAQALAGKYMLRRRGIPSTLHLGVAKDQATDLEAHAWLRSGDVVVAGGGDLDRFTLLATYA